MFIDGPVADLGTPNVNGGFLSSLDVHDFRAHDDVSHIETPSDEFRRTFQVSRRQSIMPGIHILNEWRLINAVSDNNTSFRSTYCHEQDKKRIGILPNHGESRLTKCAIEARICFHNVKVIM